MLLGTSAAALTCFPARTICPEANTMLPNWLDASPSIKFGESLAQFFVENAPHDPKVSEKKFAIKTSAVLERMDRKIEAFKADHKLNIYKKAKLGNAFKWTLKDSGHDKEYIDKLTDWLVTRL
jgi:hypothetical protein